MGENGGIKIEKVGQMDRQIWTQENYKIDLGFSLTTNSICYEGGLWVGER
jgi:hypothetical protein